MVPRRRKTNDLRVLHGEGGRVQPNFGGGLGAPKPPAWLDKEAKAEWRRVVAACADYPTWLQQVDRAVLAAYCVQWSVFVAAAKDLAVRGPLVEARSDNDRVRDVLVKNPAVQICRDASAQLRGLAAKLGFTPDDRGRIDVGDFEPSGDAFERLLS